ncbi:MAG: hypothetical protein QOE82_2004 [Thermoanaerobaculia bacterium]|jgi:hypothetical protein|nr:hypothetical protein [Thermoanaerobaculia bacterium]
MGVRSVRNAGLNRNVRLSSSVLRNSSRRLRKPRGSGREDAAGVAAVAIAVKNPHRIRTHPLRSSNRVRHASRILPVRRRRRVRTRSLRAKKAQPLARRVMVLVAAGAFAGAVVVAEAARKADPPRPKRKLGGEAVVRTVAHGLSAVGKRDDQMFLSPL